MKKVFVLTLATLVMGGAFAQEKKATQEKESCKKECKKGDKDCTKTATAAPAAKPAQKATM